MKKRLLGVSFLLSTVLCFSQNPAVSEKNLIEVEAEHLYNLLPEAFQHFLSHEILGYNFWRIGLILMIVLLSIGLSWVLNRYIKKLSAKIINQHQEDGKNFISSLVLSLRRPIKILLWTISIRIVSLVLLTNHGPAAIWISDTLLSIALVAFIYDFLDVVEHYLLLQVKKTDTHLDDMIVPIIKRGLRILVIIILALYLYQSISGQNITTIIAGFGLAGMAVALAAQDSLKNLFGFVMIALDQPFKIGERINFDGHDGVIEEVGLRSTKLRRLDGHLVSIPNMKAADNVIHNISKRESLQRIMNIALPYDTSIEKIEKALEILKSILKDHEGMNPDFPPRVYFNDLKTDCLNIFIIYWYFNVKYWEYLDHCQWVNFEILKRFEKEGIKMAYPSQTVYLAGESEQAKDFIQKIKQDPKGQLPI